MGLRTAFPDDGSRRRNEHVDDARARANLAVIEMQLATFRTLLHLKAAEHHAQRQMDAEWRSSQ